MVVKKAVLVVLHKDRSMQDLKQIRWQQRFDNLQRALRQLRKGVSLTEPNELEIQGIIQSFEFSFELAWKTLKDYLESQGVSASYPREVIKSAFRYEILKDGAIWLEMLEKRNLLAHTYDEKLALDAHTLIRDSYSQELFSVEIFFQNLLSQQHDDPTA